MTETENANRCPKCRRLMSEHCDHCGYGLTDDQQADLDAVRALAAKIGSSPPQKKAEVPKRISNVIQGDNAEMIANVAALYFKDGMKIADTTFGRGAFWRKVDMRNYQFNPSDIITGKNDSAIAPHDCRKLPYPTMSFDVVAFDPPFTRQKWYEKKYRTGTFQMSNPQIVQLYIDGMTEANRILKFGGLLLVKCQDTVHHGKQFRMSHKVFVIATRQLRMHDEDKFILVAGTNKRFDSRHYELKHAQKGESYLWVFRK